MVDFAAETFDISAVTFQQLMALCPSLRQLSVNMDIFAEHDPLHLPAISYCPHIEYMRLMGHVNHIRQVIPQLCDVPSLHLEIIAGAMGPAPLDVPTQVLQSLGQLEELELGEDDDAMENVVIVARAGTRTRTISYDGIGHDIRGLFLQSKYLGHLRTFSVADSLLLGNDDVTAPFPLPPSSLTTLNVLLPSPEALLLGPVLDDPPPEQPWWPCPSLQTLCLKAPHFDPVGIVPQSDIVVLIRDVLGFSVSRKLPRLVLRNIRVDTLQQGDEMDELIDELVPSVGDWGFPGDDAFDDW